MAVSLPMIRPASPGHPEPHVRPASAASLHGARRWPPARPMAC